MNESELEVLLDHVLRPELRALSAYHVADATGMVKLDAMENPYPWPGSLPGWPDVLARVDVNRYPDPKASRLVTTLRQKMGIPDRYQVLLGNGSDEIIHLLIQSVASDSAVILSPEPSFVMYRVLAEANRAGFQGVNLLDDFQMNLPDMLNAIKIHRPKLLFLACPNNPTGVRYPEATIRQLIESSSGLVVVDEAYTAFSDADALPLLDDYPNLLIMRTLSKMGLAGLRLGFLVGQAGWIEEIDKLRLPYNINILTQVAAEFALQNYAHLQQQALTLRQARSVMADALQQLAIERLWPSEANFILFKTAHGQARSIFEALKQQGVLIKCLDGAHPLLEDCLRVTVGSEEQNGIFLNALRSTLSS